MNDGQTWFLTALIVSFLLCGYVFGSISAMVGVNDVTLRERMERNEPAAKRLYDFLHSPFGFMDHARTIGWIFNIIASAIATTWQTLLYREHLFSGFSPAGGMALSLLLAVIVTILILIIFGVKVPQLLGNRFCETWGYHAVRPVRVMFYLLSPLCMFIRWISRLVGRIFGADPIQTEESITKEEIRMMVDAGNEMGFIEESQKEMINNIFEFDDTTAGEVMTHRTDIVAVDKDARISEVVYLAINEGFSRLPVYEKDLDNIVGLIYVKDLLCLVGCTTSEEFKISDFVRPVLYVPESVKCRALFAEFKKQQAHMAVVIDEYGGTAGIVSMEDVLESIVGDIEDEYDEQEEEEIQQLADGVYILEGIVELDEVSKITHIPFEEDEDLDTLGGFLIHKLGHIPDKDENPQVIYGGWRFTVLTMDERRIDKVRLQRIEPEEPVEKQEEET